MINGFEKENQTTNCLRICNHLMKKAIQKSGLPEIDGREWESITNLELSKLDDSNLGDGSKLKFRLFLFKSIMKKRGKNGPETNNSAKDNT